MVCKARLKPSRLTKRLVVYGKKMYYLTQFNVHLCSRVFGMHSTRANDSGALKGLEFNFTAHSREDSRLCAVLELTAVVSLEKSLR